MVMAINVDDVLKPWATRLGKDADEKRAELARQEGAAN